MKTEREMFEAWAKPRKYVLIGATVDGVFSYLNQKTSIAWDSWQASASRKGYKLVPVEPTYKQLDALKNSCELFKKAGVSDLEAHGAYKAMIGAAE